MTPPQKEITSFYAALGRSQQEVFPIAFKANDGLATGIVSGSIPGFGSSGEKDEIVVVKQEDPDKALHCDSGNRAHEHSR